VLEECYRRINTCYNNVKSVTHHFVEFIWKNTLMRRILWMSVTRVKLQECCRVLQQ
jgi:hypothetical protein